MPLATEMWIKTLDEVAQSDTNTPLERDLAMLAVGLIQACGLHSARANDFLQRRAEMAVGE